MKNKGSRERQKEGFNQHFFYRKISQTCVRDPIHIPCYYLAAKTKRSLLDMVVVRQGSIDVRNETVRKATHAKKKREKRQVPVGTRGDILPDKNEQEEIQGNPETRKV